MADEYLSPASALDPTAPIPALSDFIDFVRLMVGEVPTTILNHHHNLSRQNRPGQVKQSYYALVHFLSDSAKAHHAAESLAPPLDLSVLSGLEVRVNLARITVLFVYGLVLRWCLHSVHMG